MVLFSANKHTEIKIITKFEMRSILHWTIGCISKKKFIWYKFSVDVLENLNVQHDPGKWEYEFVVAYNLKRKYAGTALGILRKITWKPYTRTCLHLFFMIPRKENQSSTLLFAAINHHQSITWHHQPSLSFPFLFLHYYSNIN